MKFTCDVCKLPVTSRTGVLHAQENCTTEAGDVEGFAFYRWNNEAARDPQYGCVHQDCVVAKLCEYLKQFQWGRLALHKGKSVIVGQRFLKDQLSTVSSK